ncbi:hypothetical protein VQ03_22755 [Methylobacterium tarhaniae]|uniref:Uncharacterized protein n=1 Tax=Methylobacterium tarhaniae TaxID=1187852 RepID=A0A0J6SIB0_9HYPH|nr:hypothetical protein [Methylobacterium tarhaniae]KMO34970.1 hypothetical protein VQ03_22755 [Methylobacterium tarhaniae]
MLVTREYMLEKPSGPSKPKLFLDQVVVPGLANAAGAVEAGIERLVIVARRNPALAVGVVAGLGLALTLARSPRRPS